MSTATQIQDARDALGRGHLEQAGRILSGPGLLACPEGLRLRDRIVSALLERTRGHLAQGRTDEAWIDCCLATSLIEPGVSAAASTYDVNGQPSSPGTSMNETRPEPALETLLLRADCAGSFLLFRGSTVTVGPISSPHPYDLGLIADPSAPGARIVRSDDAYMLYAERPIGVNGRPTTERLLADGDRIDLSPRCRMRFELPHPASPTALLRLTGARCPIPDVRCAVLMGGPLVVGSASSAHVRVDAPGFQAVLYEQGSGLRCRSDETILDGVQTLDPADPLPVGRPLRVGPIGLTIEAA